MTSPTQTSAEEPFALEGSSAGADQVDAALEATRAVANLTAAAAAATAASADQHATADLPLRRNRDFRIVLGGQTVSAFGDAVTFTAMPLLVLAITGSGIAMGLVGALQTIPDLILGLPAGAIADRWDRRKLMLWADAGRALLTALIPIAVLAGWNTMVVIVLVTAPINALRVLFMAGFSSSVPSLVGRSQVARANGTIEAILSLSFIAGPALAGILVGTIGAGQTLAIDAVSFAVSAASLSLVRRPLQAARLGPRDTHFIADIVEGLRFVIHQRTLRTVITYWSATSVVAASLTNALIYLLTIDQHATPQIARRDPLGLRVRLHRRCRPGRCDLTAAPGADDARRQHRERARALSLSPSSTSHSSRRSSR